MCCCVQGCYLHATVSVQPSPDNMREIVECAGGRVSHTHLSSGNIKIYLSLSLSLSSWSAPVRLRACLVESSREWYVNQIM